MDAAGAGAAQKAAIAAAGPGDAAPPPAGLIERGGEATPTDGRGPVQTPRARWEVDLGAVISAAPTIVVARGDDAIRGVSQGTAVAYVGTHDGRFVGVPVEGSGAGRPTTDLYVDGMVFRRAAADESAGRLYFGADDDTVRALDLASGELAWSARVGECKPARARGPMGTRCDPDGGPTLGPDGELYVGADGMYRLDASTGEVVWHWTGSADPPPSHVYSIPLVTSDGLVVFGGWDGSVTALAADDGTEAWRLDLGPDVDGSPAQGPDGTIYIGADDGLLRALDRDGALRWVLPTKGSLRGATGVAADGSLYIASMDGNLYAAAPDGAVRWVLPTQGPIVGTPLVDGVGNVYVGSRDDRLYGVTPQGKVMFAVELPADLDASLAVSPAGTLVVASDDGYLRAVR